MMWRTISIAVALAFVLGTPNPAAAQSDFNGTWTANMRKSDFGSLASPSSFVRVIEHDEIHVSIAITVNEGERRQTGELLLTTDGEESTGEVGGSEVTGYAHWLGDHLLIHTTRESQGMKMTTYELWTLAGDGKTLQVDASVSTPMGEERLQVIFDKQ